MLSLDEFMKYLSVVIDYEELTTSLNSTRFSIDSPVLDRLSKTVISLLETLMKDTENHWIQYWCYELNFGTNWRKGMITDENGYDIVLKDVSDLYLLLLSNI